MTQIRPPEKSRRKTLLEIAGLTTSLARAPLWVRPTRRELSPQKVLVLPGFMTGDFSTIAIRRFLKQHGIDAVGWNLGRNTGEVFKLIDPVLERVDELTSDGPISIVGWSLGGVLARAAARERPESVTNIVTLGTPLIGGPKYTVAADLYLERGIDLDHFEKRVHVENMRTLSMPISVIFSKNDAVVAWEACMDPNDENDVTYIETSVGHMAMGFDRTVLKHVLDGLSRL